MIERRTFRAMGTEIELLVDADDAGDALDAAEAEFHRLEALLSRFRDDSELSRLNRDGSIDAGPDLLRVVELALAARERTGGRFDPTVHDARRRGRLRPVLRGHRPGEPRPVPGTGRGRRRRVRRRRRGSSSTPASASTSAGSARATRPSGRRSCSRIAGPCLVNAGGDIATRGGSLAGRRRDRRRRR